jgi:GNAT superfamily N-acetyltransferase
MKKVSTSESVRLFAIIGSVLFLILSYSFLFTFGNIDFNYLLKMDQIHILPYSPELKPYFKSINTAWVEELFSLEPFDLAQFEDPEKVIINSGGTIIFAKLREEIVGTVALYKTGEDTFELIKMGVSKAAQGKGVGMVLGKSILEKAKELGAKKLVLYSNSKLKPAIHIYQKLGFKQVYLEEGKYLRCDVKMEIEI